MIDEGHMQQMEESVMTYKRRVENYGYIQHLPQLNVLWERY